MIYHLQKELRPLKQQSCQCQRGRQTKTGLNSRGRRSADQGNPLSLFEVQELVRLSREGDWWFKGNSMCKGVFQREGWIYVKKERCDMLQSRAKLGSSGLDS